MLYLFQLIRVKLSTVLLILLLYRLFEKAVKNFERMMPKQKINDKFN